MKKKIRANPFIGTKDADGTFQYKEGNFAIRYAIIGPVKPNEKNIPRWISFKIRAASYEMFLKKLKKELEDFWRYQKWLVFFHPSTLLPLIFIGLIIYFGVVDLQPGRGYLIRWLASRAIGVSPNEIEYKGGGWIRMSGTRTTAVDRQREPFRYDINVFRWLVFNDAGSVTRYRGREYGPVTHPVGYDESGEAYLKKEGKWKRGKTADGIKWDRPQGTGIREGKIKSHTIETTEGKIEIRDK